MRIKRGLVVVSLVPLALVLALGVLAWAQQPTQTRFEGTFASYDSSNPILDGGGNTIGFESYHVYLGEGMGTGAVQVKQWRLNFQVNRMLFGPPTSQVNLIGSGPIPDDTVTLGNPKGRNLAVSVDISALPTFPDPMAFGRSKTCLPGPTCDPAIDLNFGVIDLQWEWTNDLWNKSEEHSVLDFGKYWQHTQGSTDEHSALVRGFLFGIEILPVEIGYPPGRIGETKSLTITHPK